MDEIYRYSDATKIGLYISNSEARRVFHGVFKDGGIACITEVANYDIAITWKIDKACLCEISHISNRTVLRMLWT